MANFLVVAIAIFLDRLFGELTIYHPLKGFTHIATYLEDHWHLQEDLIKHTPENKQLPQPQESQQSQESNQLQVSDKADGTANKAFETALKIKGALAAALLVLPFMGFTAMVGQSLPDALNFVFNILILYLAMGAHSLKQHSFDVQNALISENLELARKHLATIIHHDTKNMDRQDIISICVESIVENGSEIILAPIFWFLVLGAPGVVLCSLIHVLNAMWSCHNSHYKDFGWVISKVNDVLNWVPSRLTAFSYILLGDKKNAWYCLNKQAKNWNSPNAELVIATGAGALHLEVGGDLYYQDQIKNRSKLGNGKIPDLSDIARASDLVERSMVLWLACVLIISLGH